MMKETPGECPVHSLAYILEKVKRLNADTHVAIRKITLEESGFWFYDEASGMIVNRNRSFFRIAGFRKTMEGRTILEQPIILQDEIGYLGIICQRICGTMHYLMQYKIEPGNVNQIQISPTIQATKSNFTQKHGGKRPAYLDWFLNAGKYRVIVDQIQSEQSSRFRGKRNRNIVIEIPEDEKIEVLPSHDWMTLRQLKALMRHDNLVNMDTRTVLSCLPVSFPGTVAEWMFTDQALWRSVAYGDGGFAMPEIYRYVNNYKMFDEGVTENVPLYSLKDWKMRGGEFVCSQPYSFKVVFCDIEIEGREVRRWTQPLFEATGVATFGLLTCVDGGIRKFLVRCRPEVGCFDGIELGPSVQREYVSAEPETTVDVLFRKKLAAREGILFDTLLSEEGGRFYHEQNRNVVMEVKKDEVELPEGCFWCDFRTLNMLVQVNNVLNIQLRNLLSVLEW